MPPLSVRRLLGPPPLLRGLLRWGVAVLCVLGAWHLYQWYPLPGLVAIGIAPVLSLFLFFRGLNLIARTLPYWKTRRSLLATRLQPTWEDRGAGYFFVDEQRGLWIINGASGKLTDIARLHAHGDGLGHRLDVYAASDKKPAAFYGFHDDETLRAAAERLQRACFAHSGKEVPLTYNEGFMEDQTPRHSNEKAGG